MTALNPTSSEKESVSQWKNIQTGNPILIWFSPAPDRLPLSYLERLPSGYWVCGFMEKDETFSAGVLRDATALISVSEYPCLDDALSGLESAIEECALSIKWYAPQTMQL